MRYLMGSFLCIFATLTSAQSLVKAERVEVIPIISVGDPKYVECGYRVHSIAEGEHATALDYDVQLILLVSDASNVVDGMTVAKIFKSYLNEKKDQESIPPSDVYIALHGVKEIVRFLQITSPDEGAVAGSFTGVVKQDLDGKSNNSVVQFIDALRTRAPMLVSFVMLPGQNNAFTVRVAPTFTDDQKAALDDCFDRAYERMKSVK